MYLFANLIRK